MLGSYRELPLRVNINNTGKLPVAHSVDFVGRLDMCHRRLARRCIFLMGR